jgi:hypothetical protein
MILYFCCSEISTFFENKSVSRLPVKETNPSLATRPNNITLSQRKRPPAQYSITIAGRGPSTKKSYSLLIYLITQKKKGETFDSKTT